MHHNITHNLSSFPLHILKFSILHTSSKASVFILHLEQHQHTKSTNSTTHCVNTQFARYIPAVDRPASRVSQEFNRIEYYKYWWMAVQDMFRQACPFVNACTLPFGFSARINYPVLSKELPVYFSIWSQFSFELAGRVLWWREYWIVNSEYWIEVPGIICQVLSNYSFKSVN